MTISRVKTIIFVAFILFVAGVTFVYANHSWGNYHWARQANSFTLKLGDNVSSVWDAYLGQASLNLSVSTELDTVIVSGSTNPKNCRAMNGRVEVCSSKYGFNGWLGIASIWISDSHITKSTVKVNDSYFNTSTYNTPAWRRFVMCQEIGHTFGLDHQDVDFSNPNLGTCMDYTSNPSGPPSNEHPDAHDYEQLEAIYTHLDSTTTVSQTTSRGFRNNSEASASEWGKGIQKDSKGKTSLYVRDLGNDEKVFTFVFWAN